MRVKSVEEAESLVGRTFEKDGKCREVTRIDHLKLVRRGDESEVSGDVYWRRPGKQERLRPVWLPYFNDWLEEATEVAE